MSIRVVVADRRRLMREALAALVDDSADMNAVMSVRTLADATDAARAAGAAADGVIAVLIGDVADADTADVEDSTVDRTVRLADHRGWGSVRAALAGNPVAPASEPAVVLTSRERAVLAAASSGRSAAEVAIELRISARTVESHTQSAMAKLGARSTAHAVARAIELHLLDGAG